VLRGFAILGILVMNIQSFSMVGAAYLNPTAYGDLTGLNKWIWILSHIFVDQKFMTLFSLLFGAGIVLITQRSDERTGKSLGLFYRRTFWLLVIGLFHAHVIWYGDILVPYAISAFFVYFLRKVKPKWQIVIGVLVISVHTLFYVGAGYSIPYWPEESVTEAMKSWEPDEQSIQDEITAYTGSFSEQMKERSEAAFFMETMVFLILFLWRTAGLMLVGMALFKLGVLTAQRSKSFYKNGFILSWIVGIPMVAYGVYRNFQAGWPLESMFIGSQYNYWGSLIVSFGYICLVMLIVKSDFFMSTQKRLAAVGQMALTNYIMQSVICTFIFYGFGLGLFGKIDRAGQVLIMLGVLILQLYWSKAWLTKFRFGPLEWLWRTLTYMKRQPMKVELQIT